MLRTPVRLATITAALFALTAPPAWAKPAPGVSGALSIIPGLGQVANGDTLEGAGWFVASLGLFISRSTTVSNIGFKLWEYNMYDAYRDAGAHETTKYNVVQNYVAFVNPLNIVDPFSAGIIGVGTASALASKNRAHIGPNNRVAGAFYYGFVGLGEEGLFRGFLYPGFSDLLDSHFFGAVTSSALFSLSHLTNTQSYYHSGAGLSELFLFGMVLCWQTSYNRFDLRHGIFAHAWYDFIVDYVNAGAGAKPASLPAMGIRMTIPLEP